MFFLYNTGYKGGLVTGWFFGKALEIIDWIYSTLGCELSCTIVEPVEIFKNQIVIQSRRLIGLLDWKKKLETAKGSALIYCFKGKPTVQNAMFAEVVD